MWGEIKDFNESLMCCVELFKGLDVSVLECVYVECLQFFLGVEKMFKVVQLLGICMLLVLGGFEFFILCLQECLGFDCMCVNILEIVDGKFIGWVFGEIVNVDVKVQMFKVFCQDLGVLLYNVIVMGDGLNDFKMMGVVGLLVVFCVKFIVQVQVDVVFNVVGLDGLLNLFLQQ